MMYTTRPSRWWRNQRLNDDTLPAFRRARALRRAKRGQLSRRELRNLLNAIKRKEQHDNDRTKK